MGQVIDFPTNYEEKLHQADQLIEKGYIDEAICLIEDFIVNSKPKQGKQLLQKKILTCYCLKKEFESAKELLEEMELDFSDLSLIAHHILLLRFEGDSLSSHCFELKAKEQLSPFALKNLNELIAQLKTYYEEYWYHLLEQEINRLTESRSLEQALLMISDLYQYSSEELTWFTKQIVHFCESTTFVMLRMLIFELLAQKNIHCTLSLTESVDGTVSLVETSQERLSLLQNQVEEAIKQVELMHLEDGIQSYLNQQIYLFYQFCFPNDQQVDMTVAIEGLLGFILGREIEFFKKNDLKSTESPIINYTSCKLSQYMLSLSSLM